MPAPTCWRPRATRRRSRRRRGCGCARARTGKICSSACCWSASSRIWGATTRPSSRTGRRRRRRWRGATRPIPAPPCASSCYVCGIELANAFEELTDAAEQRARFVADRARRHAAGGPDWPLDEDFLAALAHGMPPCSGHRARLRPAGDDRVGGRPDRAGHVDAPHAEPGLRELGWAGPALAGDATHRAVAFAAPARRLRGRAEPRHGWRP